MNDNKQEPVISPGWAILCFPAGVVELAFRVLIVAMLIVCLVLSITLPTETFGTEDGEMYWTFIERVIVVIWSFLVTSIAILIEFIGIVLRILNIRCFNNCYIVYGILDIVRYILLAICLALSSAGFSFSRDVYINAANRCNRNYPGDPVCDELRDGSDDLVAPTVLFAVTTGIIAAAVVWEIIYLAAGCNNRLPVPRVDDKV